MTETESQAMASERLHSEKLAGSLQLSIYSQLKK